MDLFLERRYGARERLSLGKQSGDPFVAPIAGGCGDLLTVAVSHVHGDITLVNVRGEVDLFTVGKLQEGLDQACAAGGPVVLNLEATTYLDGRGIRAIDCAARRLNSSTRGFVLVGSHPTIHKLLKLCFKDDICIVDTVHEGLACLRGEVPPHCDGGASGGGY